ncbi:Uncharacterised protein [Vibrio cholerae]|nr:Uncharacterised protein [Vibrio cholerae]
MGLRRALDSLLASRLSNSLASVARLIVSPLCATREASSVPLESSHIARISLTSASLK